MDVLTACSAPDGGAPAGPNSSLATQGGRFPVTGIIHGRPFAQEAADGTGALAALATHLYHDGM